MQWEKKVIRIWREVDLFRNCSLENIPSVLPGYVPPVQFGRVRVANMNQQKPPGLSQIGPSQQEWLEPAGTPGEALCCASVNEVKISEDVRTMMCSKASYARPHQCPLGPVYTPANHHGSSRGSHLTTRVSKVVWVGKTACESDSVDITLPIGPSLRKLPEHHRKFFGVFLSMNSWLSVTIKEREGISIPSGIIRCLLGP